MHMGAMFLGGPHLASQARRLCEVGKEASKTRRDLLGTTRQREVEIGQRPQVLPETGGQPGGGSLRGVDLLKGRVQAELVAGNCIRAQAAMAGSSGDSLV